MSTDKKATAKLRIVECDRSHLMGFRLAGDDQAAVLSVKRGGKPAALAVLGMKQGSKTVN